MYYHTDHLGTTHLFTDSSGTPITAEEYEPFGEPTVSGDEESFLFTGKEHDASHLYYFGARYYDPDMGRFITRDVMPGTQEKPQSLNMYSYCLNNPLRYIDPTGNESEDPQEIIEEIFSQLQNGDPDTITSLRTFPQPL